MRYTRKLKRTHRGFTIIELLFVVLILSILMAVGLPLYLLAMTDAQIKACRGNMQTIANADQAYRAIDSGHAYTTNINVLKPNLGETPICPTGGNYSIVISNGTHTSNGMTVPVGGLIINCTDHGTFAPGTDND